MCAAAVDSMGFGNIMDVVRWRLCVGCGACASICPEGKVGLRDLMAEGIRPVLDTNGCGSCDLCVRVCPGYETTNPCFDEREGLITELERGWGPILEIWEGYASDAEIRFKGCSGGVATAIALYCLEKEGMSGALHTGSDNELPWKNQTVLGLDRNQLLQRTGSRYSPASPCDGLNKMVSAGGPCVFIGKPCDVTGLRKAQFLRPELGQRVGIAIGIFCAGTPSSKGTLDLLRRLRVDPRGELKEIRYRGMGWPGMASVQLKGRDEPSYQMSYMESWGFLEKYRPYRCYLCPDGTSEFADIACGDPWYRRISEGEEGYSLVLVRTKKGRKTLHGAISAGYVVLERADPRILEASQKNLLSKRCAVWGRLLIMKVFGIPIPKYSGFPLFDNWMTLSFSEKLKSIFGTMKRVLYRGYYRPQKSSG